MKNTKHLTILRTLLNDETISLTEEVQSLWSGYGQIIKCFSRKTNQRYVVKVVAPDNAEDHPRGWGSSLGHQRKIQSYQIEGRFYQAYSAQLDSYTKVPSLVASAIIDNTMLLVMEDLDASGFSLRKEKGSEKSLKLAIRWLAYFHMKFMGNNGKGLWKSGTYWHLGTRQDEWNGMPANTLKDNAEHIDCTLRKATFQTLVHGDAKFANLCFHENNQEVAAVDFQYVGRGSGVQDLAYLAGSCLDNDELFEFDNFILEQYILNLHSAASFYNKSIDLSALEQEVRFLYPVAWADFYRFLLGWNPQSWKICTYMKEKSNLAIQSL